MGDMSAKGTTCPTDMKKRGEHAMDAIEMIRNRRSVRKFKAEPVARHIMETVLGNVTFAPSWGNFQEIHYTIVDDRSKIAALAENGFGSFKGNGTIVGNAPGVLVVSMETGRGGYSPKGKKVTVKGDDAWGMFDAGVASQTFCLAAWEQGIGTVMMGIFDEAAIADLVGLPDGQVVAAVIPFGYPDGETTMPKRKPVRQIARFI
jgi:nitroreductase